MFRSILYLSAVIVAINVHGIDGECISIRNIRFDVSIFAIQ